MTDTVMLESQRTNAPAVDVGIPENDRKTIADGLAHVFADTYTLYLKTHHYHWNVTGPQFTTYHLMFEEHYRDMWAATDDLAERMRALGAVAPGTPKEMGNLTTIETDEPGVVPKAEDMVRNLVTGHETLIKNIRALLPNVQDVNDETSNDLLVERLRYHEKTAWMLRSLLE